MGFSICKSVTSTGSSWGAGGVVWCPGAGECGRSGPHSSAGSGGLRRLCRSLEQIGANEPIQVAVEHALRVADLVTRPRVLDLLIRVEDVAADRVAAEAHVHAPALARQFRLPLLLCLLGET